MDKLTEPKIQRQAVNLRMLDSDGSPVIARVTSPLSPLSSRLCRDVTPAARFLYPIQYNAILLKVTEVLHHKYT